MKICILTSAHPPLDARIFYKEARSLQKAGFEVVVIAPPGGKDQKSPLGEAPEEMVEQIRIRYVPSFKGRIQRLFNLKNIYRAALEERADVYHFHDPDLIFTGLKLQRKLQKPVVYDVHEYYADSLRTRYWLPAPFRKGIAFFFDKFEKYAARKFAGILTVNHHMEDLFKKVNPVGVSLFNFPLKEQFVFDRPEGPRAIPETQNGRTGPKILYLGGINKERGLEVILEGMVLVRKRYPEAVCDLVGPVDLGGISKKYLPLEDWLQKGNIQVRGKVPYNEVPHILKRSHIALVPLLPTLNYQKAIPVKLLEYMAAGLPVVGSRFGYIESIIRENQCGRLAVPADPQALAEEICFLIENPLQALEYAQNGWDAFHSEYSWESQEGKLLEFYAGILGTNRDSRD